MKKKDVFYDDKRFLNLPGHSGMANIGANITAENYGSFPGINFWIADCDRKVSFDMSLYSEYERDNSLHKIDVMIDFLEKFKKAVFAAACASEEIEKIEAEEDDKNRGDKKKESNMFRERCENIIIEKFKELAAGD